LGACLLITTVAVACLAVARATARLVRRRSTRSLALAVTLPAGSALLAEAANAVILLVHPVEHFETVPGTVAYAVRTGALIALGVGIGWATAWRLWVARQRVGVLAAGLDGLARPGEIDSRLGQALHDDSLEIRYLLPGSDDLVDAAGRRAPVRPDDTREKLVVTRARQPLALVLHDPDRVAGEELEAGLGPLARLVIENERLRASASSHLVELQASRARIVAAADDARRAVERDLHDSAQQRLLAAAFELRLGRAECSGADPETLAELDRLVEVAAAVLEDLREFAHGVFPAVLDEAGLEAALMSVADAAAVPVELDLRGLDTVPAPAARATYGVVRAAVERAPASAGVDVRVERCDGRVDVEVTGGGPVDAVRLGDRVGAVGGVLEVGHGCVRAVIPCAS
jgi:signal transduction histidine kinase